MPNSQQSDDVSSEWKIPSKENQNTILYATEEQKFQLNSTAVNPLRYVEKKQQDRCRNGCASLSQAIWECDPSGIYCHALAT